MDIKKYRREAGIERDQIDDNYRRREYALGNAASDQNPFWWARAQSWSEGADTAYWAVEEENQEQHEKLGIPGRFR
jgi:hypothetical protein